MSLIINMLHARIVMETPMVPDCIGMFQQRNFRFRAYFGTSLNFGTEKLFLLKFKTLTGLRKSNTDSIQSLTVNIGIGYWCWVVLGILSKLNLLIN